MREIDEILLRKYYYEEKLPKAVIANKFNVCKRTILDRIKKLGWSERPPVSFLVENLTGKKINKLTFITYVKNDKFGKALWKCKCDCGKEKILNASAIKAHLTTSCGCNKQKSLRKGYEEISGAFWKKLQRSAISRNIEFTITLKEAWDIYTQQNKKCALSGVDLIMFSNNDVCRKQTASPDRIDSSKGYTKNNFQWVHKRVNRMKNILSTDEFLFWVHKIKSTHPDAPKTKYDPCALSWD